MGSLKIKKDVNQIATEVINLQIKALISKSITSFAIFLKLIFLINEPIYHL